MPKNKQQQAEERQHLRQRAEADRRLSEAPQLSAISDAGPTPRAAAPPVHKNGPSGPEGPVVIISVVFALAIIGICVYLDTCVFFSAVMGLGLVAMALVEWAKSETLKQMPPEQREETIAAQAHGPLRPEMICPHCQASGKVRTKQVKRKKGISGAKATAGVMTGGASLLATGLSRKEVDTEAFCSNCKCIWHF